MALEAGADFHIMSSALDIAHDIFIPSLREARFKRAILCVCPYSVAPITLPLLICGIETLVIQYDRGYCTDYNQWSLADRGIKQERTFLSREGQALILDTLSAIAETRAQLGLPSPHRFRKKGNIYTP